MEWISVETELPKRDIDVLIFYDGKVSHGEYDHIAKQFVSHGWEIARVTHWRPPPPPPSL